MPQKYIKCSRRFADEWGLDVAVVMEQVKYWLVRNSDKPDSLHDGKVWFYSSVRELTEKYFPYWTPRQLSVLLDYMVDVGLLQCGRYNKKRYDRTKWYTLVDDRILTVEDYAPERKSKTRRRAISRISSSRPSHGRVKGFVADVQRSHPSVRGSDADVKCISPTCGTYTTTKQQLNTMRPSDVEGGKEPPSNVNSLFQNDGHPEDSIPLPPTEGRIPVSGLGEVTPPPLRRKGDAPHRSDTMDGVPWTVRAAPSSQMDKQTKDLLKWFDELFQKPKTATELTNLITTNERVQS